MHFGNLAYVVYIALACGIVLAFYGLYLFWKNRVMARVAADPRIRRLILRERPIIARMKTALVALAILLAGIVLLRPQWGESAREERKEGVDLLIALDVSMSMMARDVSPSRLARAKDAIRLMADSVKGDRVGLVLFAGDAFLQCPLTNDLGAFSMFLDAASPDAMRLQGTDLGAAVSEAERVFAKRRRTSRVFALITDGEDHQGALEAAMERFAKLEVTVFTVGIGASSGDYIPLAEADPSGDSYARDAGGNLIRTKKNTETLERIASRTGGEYVDITESLAGVYRITRAMSRMSANEYGARVVKERNERYQIFALVLAVLLAIEIMLPGRRREV